MRPSRLPFAIAFGALAALLVFLAGGAFAWKILNAAGVWPVGGVDSWLEFLGRLLRSPRGTLAGLHLHFQARFFLPVFLSLVAWVAVAWWSARSQQESDADVHIRGRRYITGGAALAAFQKRSGQECEAEGAGIRLHPSMPAISVKREARHFLIFGGVGSGKTQTILPLMLAAQTRADCLLIYDNKGDFTAKLPARSVTLKGRDGKAVQKVLQPILLAPWDSRSAQWEIAADVADKSAAREFAAAVVPESKSSPMWSSAARQVLAGCIVQLQTQKPGLWGFKDLAALCFRGELEAHQETMKTYFQEGLMAVSGANVTTMGILINMTSFLSPIADLADTWPEPPAPGKGFSLRRWLQQERPLHRIVIIQGNGRFEQLAQAFAKALFSLAAQVVTDPAAVGESTTRRLWVFLDEFPQLGELSRVAPLLEVGRSKGVRVVLGIQDVAQLKAIYGADRASTWQSLTGNQIVCQLQPGATSKWVAEECIGDREVERVAVSRTTGSGPAGGIFSPGGTRTSNIVRETRAVLLPSQLQSDLGPRATGVDILWLGYGDALRLSLPYTKLPDVREAVRIADWTFNPATREQVARMVEEAQQAEARPAPRVPVSPAPQPPADAPAVAAPPETDGPAMAAAPESDSHGHTSEPITAAPAARDALSFLDGDDRDDDEEGEQAAGLPVPAIPAPAAGVTTHARIEQITETEPPLIIPKSLAAVAAEESGDELKDKVASAAGAALLISILPGVGHLAEIAETLVDAGEAVAGPQPDVIPQPQQPRRKFKRRAQSLEDQPEC